MNKIKNRLILLSFITIFSACNNSENRSLTSIESKNKKENSKEKIDTTEETGQKEGSNIIKLGILLDTSNSMDELIDQVKSQLWSIINQLSTAKKNNENADIQIALYQYGNDNLDREEGYIEQILPLTNDLDLLSEKLFSLTTNGGEEYCGQAIEHATNELNWENLGGLNLIFIAGNESFDQGRLHFKNACNNATNKNITINTIFCGDTYTGINSYWKEGATISEGNYFNIDMSQKTVYTSTPFDKDIEALNDDLNSTYIPFGSSGKHKKSNQIAQDYNSIGYGSANATSRIISKSSHLYNNSSWDLVDAKNQSKIVLSDIKTEDLPEEMKSMNGIEKTKYIEEKSEKRKKVQLQIKQLSEQRSSFLTNQNANENNKNFDYSMMTAIRLQAEKKGFTFTNSSNKKEKAFVNFDFFEKTMAQAKINRANKLIDFNTFIKMSQGTQTVILDTRSKFRFDKMHIKGAIHLNFSDFTQETLANIIPNFNTRVLIYCNNNFKQEPLFIENFATKSVRIEPLKPQKISVIDKTLALNIPTYINLFGYGYKNVYELSELVNSQNSLLELEGTDVY